MAGVSEDEGASRTDSQTARGCEAQLSLSYEGVVQIKQNLGRIIGGLTAAELPESLKLAWQPSAPCLIHHR